jgi:hypothetical protein
VPWRLAARDGRDCGLRVFSVYWKGTVWIGEGARDETERRPLAADVNGLVRVEVTVVIALLELLERLSALHRFLGGVCVLCGD